MYANGKHGLTCVFLGVYNFLNKITACEKESDVPKSTGEYRRQNDRTENFSITFWST